MSDRKPHGHKFNTATPEAPGMRCDQCGLRVHVSQEVPEGAFVQEENGLVRVGPAAFGKLELLDEEHWAKFPGCDP